MDPLELLLREQGVMSDGMGAGDSPPAFLVCAHEASELPGRDLVFPGQGVSPLRMRSTGGNGTGNSATAGSMRPVAVVCGSMVLPVWSAASASILRGANRKVHAICLPEDHPLVVSSVRFHRYVSGIGPGGAEAISVRTGALAPVQPSWLDNVSRLLPPSPEDVTAADRPSMSQASYERIIHEEVREVRESYERSGRLALLSYLLRSPAERKRLRIAAVPADSRVREWGERFYLPSGLLPKESRLLGDGSSIGVSGSW